MIRKAHAAGRKIGICGQAPSDHPEFARFLVEQGIDSISLNPDSYLKTVPRIAEAETESAVAAAETESARNSHPGSGACRALSRDRTGLAAPWRPGPSERRALRIVARSTSSWDRAPAMAGT